MLLFLFAVPPERISIRDESNTERSSVVGPYSEGDTMKLKCDVFGGKPTPNLTWYRDGYPITSESIAVPSGRYLRSEIVVEHLSRQDLNSRFTCKAINHHRATPLETAVQLDMNCKPSTNMKPKFPPTHDSIHLSLSLSSMKSITHLAEY